MSISKIRKVLKSNNPEKQLYKLIPKSKREEFIQFAKQFGMSEETVKERIRRL